MIEHLILSTLVLALAMAAARVLPLTARTRHALLLAGLAKFAIPSAAIATLLRLLGLDLTKTAIAMPFRTLGGTAAAAPLATSTVNWFVIAYVAVALLIASRWLLLRARTVTAALHASRSPSTREVGALTEARKTLRIATPIDLLRSPICEAPAVLRVLRPVVVLPVHGCDSLDDAELRTLLLHECAHVRRRDNLVLAIEMIAAATLWFHPLVWLALRELATAREEACDEMVAEATNETATYLAALNKICRDILVTRAAGASCMASARLKERIEHMMSYEKIRKAALSHRAVVAIAIVAVLTVTTAATAVTERANSTPQRYRLSFTVTPEQAGYLRFRVDVIDTETSSIVASPDVKAPVGHWATVMNDARTIEVRMRGRNDGTAELFLRVFDGDTVVQNNLYTYTPKAASAAPSEFTGEKISINLKDADLRDVLKTFGQLTGYNIAIRPDLEGRVTVDFVDVPWDQALDVIARQNGLKVTIEGKKIYIDR